jgi:hypothetical protein
MSGNNINGQDHFKLKLPPGQESMNSSFLNEFPINGQEQNEDKQSKTLPINSNNDHIAY